MLYINKEKGKVCNSEVFSLKKQTSCGKYLSTCSPTDLSNFKLVNNQLRSLMPNLTVKGSQLRIYNKASWI